MPDLARRAFLKQSAAATLILGFSSLESLTAAEKSEDQGDWLALARERVRQEGRPGLVLIIPAEAGAINRMAEELARLLDTGPVIVPAEATPPPARPGAPTGRVGPKDGAVQRLFCQAVFVCVTLEQARKEFFGLKSDTGVVLLGPDGTVADELNADPALYGKDFAQRMTDFLHGKKGEHLAVAVKAQREALGQERCARLDAGLRDLNADTFPARLAAQRQLTPLAVRATAPLAAELRQQPALDTTRRIERLFEAVYTDALTEKPGGRLPFGVECSVVAVNTCKCGFSSAPPESRLFLRFLTGKSK